MNKITLIDESSGSNFIKNYLKELEIREQRMKEIVENKKYILWLQNFSIVHKHFFDDSWLYSSQEISREDLQRVNDLDLLYRAIDRYAQHNYISSNSCDFGNYYSIKYAGVGYNIGIMQGQGTCNFCERVEIDDEDKFINFEDIQKNKPSDKAVAISKNLDGLSEYIKALVSEKVPIWAIEEKIQTTLEELKE